MTVYCLVHGSAHGADGWELLAGELEARGHDTLCPELPRDRTEAGAAYYTEAVVEAMDRSRHRTTRVTVVGHSSAGLFLPLVAARGSSRRS